MVAGKAYVLALAGTVVGLAAVEKIHACNLKAK